MSLRTLQINATRTARQVLRALDLNLIYRQLTRRDENGHHFRKMGRNSEYF